MELGSLLSLIGLSDLRILPLLLGAAWLLPLASFALIVFFGPKMGRGGRGAAYVATAAILGSLVLSLASSVPWLLNYPLPHVGHDAAAPAEEHPADEIQPVVGEWYSLGEFGRLRLAIGYYIDGLTIGMFCMVTLVASCIHVYSFGYMHEELHEVTDPLVTVADGRPLRRRGRYPRFFQYLSLFCFSMLGLVIAGNIAMVFVFWELVGICSYFLIGFYIERKTASNAANKAFIVNRVGDFGMIIGLMALLAGLGTFSFGDYRDDRSVLQPGIFSQVRPHGHHHELVVPDRMVQCAARCEVAEIFRTAPDLPTAERLIAEKTPQWRAQGYGYWLLVIAGLGIFCGCIGKSAQFPLHVWLPDAMEGPTPVSALIHAATMVAAGVYLVGRFYPVFTLEVLLVIAHIGVITLFVAATIALVATDIKRVLAYSTVSQLGYMMLALGVGGWLAGMFHLFTHAYFKSLLFLGSGSVIHACGTNEMPRMGGLLKKMPWTGWTMLAGTLAISGAGVPLLVGLSGYYSKDYIIAQILSFTTANPPGNWIFYVTVIGAGLTACYMFRMWYMTFLGTPRDAHVYEHAHESPRIMIVPLVVLAFLAATVGWNLPGTNIGLEPLLEQVRPMGTAQGMQPLPGISLVPSVTQPAEHEALEHTSRFHISATVAAFALALVGFGFATLFYGLRKLDPADVARQFAPLHRFLCAKWYFDELYRIVFVQPVMRVSQWIATLDTHGIDWLANNLARATAAISRFDDWIDRRFVDGLVDLTARQTYQLGLRLRTLQTGSLRQYVLWVALGTVGLFVLVTWYWNYTMLRP